MNMQELKQTLFNKAYLGLKSQGFERSVDEHDDCAYRSKKENVHCAVGWLIPDELYDKKIEGYPLTTSEILHYIPDIRKYEEDGASEYEIAEISSFLDKLQEVHDKSPGPMNMEKMLKNFADYEKLTIPL